MGWKTLDFTGAGVMLLLLWVGGLGCDRRPAVGTGRTSAPVAPSGAFEQGVLAVFREGQITREQFDEMLQGLPFEKRLSGIGQPPADWERSMLREMVAREILYQEALARGLDQREDFRQLEGRQRDELLLESYVQDVLLSQIDVSEEQLRAFYEKYPELFRASATVIPFDDVRWRIRDKLLAERKDKLLQDVIALQESQRTITYHPEYLAQEGIPDASAIVRVGDFCVTLGEFRKTFVGPDFSRGRQEKILEEMKKRYILLTVAREQVPAEHSPLLARMEGFRKERLSRILMLSFIPEIRISAEEVQAAYRSRREALSQPDLLCDQVQLRVLMVRDIPERGDGRPSGEAAARRRAQEIHQLLSEGADFVQMVALYSEDPSRENLGLLDDIPDSELTQLPMESLEVGQFTMPIRVPGGYAILQLVARRSVEPKNREEEWQMLEQALSRRTFRRLMEAIPERLAYDSQLRINEAVLSP